MVDFYCIQLPQWETFWSAFLIRMSLQKCSFLYLQFRRIPLSRKCSFSIPVCQFSPRSFLGEITLEVDSLVKKCAIQFYFFSGFGGCIYCIYFGIFPGKVYTFYSFYSSSLIAYHLKMIFLLQIEPIFPRTRRLLIFLSCSWLQYLHWITNLIVLYVSW